jgi:hypothetical protein
MNTAPELLEEKEVAVIMAVVSLLGNCMARCYRLSSQLRLGM